MKLKSLTLSLVAICGLALSANAQILYKVEKPGSDKTSYLLGTHHFAPLAVIDSIAELPEILKGVDKLYGEIDMSAMTDPAAMMKMQQQMMAPADSTLDKVLTAAQLEKLGQLMAEYSGQQIPLQMLYGMKPATITAQLEALMCMKIFPALNPMEGLDMTMQNRARALGKPVAGLETMEFQTGMLYGAPIAEQAEALAKFIEDPKKEEANAVELSKAYLNHDLQTILDLMVKETADDPAYADRLIYSRNADWIEKLSKEMPEASLMVVVGAGHLPGDRGVIEGLKKVGYVITSVR